MNTKTHLEPWFIRFNIEEVGLSRVILLDICLILPCLFMMFFSPNQGEYLMKDRTVYFCRAFAELQESPSRVPFGWYSIYLKPVPVEALEL
jgi:hypothetical protein